MPTPRNANPFAARQPHRLDARAIRRIAASPSHRGPRAVDVLTPTHAAEPVAPAADGSMSGRAFLTWGGPATVRLVAIEPYLDELAASPFLEHLERLDLRGNRIGVAGMKQLAASPHLHRLVELNLADNGLGPAGIAELLRAPWRKQLRSLSVAGNGLDAESVLALADDPAFADLDDLDLGRNALPPTVAGKLPRMAVVCLLQRLVLAGNPIGPGGAAAFCAGRRLDRLRTFDLADCGIGPVGAAAIADAESMTALTDLDLSFNGIEDIGAEAIAAGAVGKLHRLNLRANRIGPAGTAALAAAAFDRLQSLDLSANALGDVSALAEGFPPLRHLHLANAGITAAGAQALAWAGVMVGLETLALAWNPIGDAGVAALASSADAAWLVELDLTGVAFGVRGARALLASPHLRKLRRLRFDADTRLPTDVAAALRDRYS